MQLHVGWQTIVCPFFVSVTHKHPHTHTHTQGTNHKVGLDGTVFFVCQMIKKRFFSNTGSNVATLIFCWLHPFMLLKCKSSSVIFFYSLSVGFGLMVGQKKPFDKLNKGFRKLWLFKKENLFPTMFLTKKSTNELMMTIASWCQDPKYIWSSPLSFFTILTIFAVFFLFTSIKLK